MLSISRLSIALVAAISVADTTRTTLNDYVVLKDAIYNPPACGVSYASLNVNKITALSGISGNYDTNCGACIQVCGSAGCDHLLVVDSCVGPDHLDISTTAGPNIVGSDTGVHETTYTFVDSSNCAGIWDGSGLDAVASPPKNWELLNNGGGSPAPAAPSNEQSYDDNYEASPPTPPAPETPQAPPATPEAPQEQPETPEPIGYPEPTSVAEAPAPPVETPAPPPAPVETPSSAPPAPATTVAPEVPAPASPSAVPGDFYEEESSIHTPVSSVPLESAAPSPTTLVTIRPSSSPSLSLPPNSVATPVTPTQTPPPVFTGTAARSSALPVLAGSMFGMALALLI